MIDIQFFGGRGNAGSGGRGAGGGGPKSANFSEMKSASKSAFKGMSYDEAVSALNAMPAGAKITGIKNTGSGPFKGATAKIEKRQGYSNVYTNFGNMKRAGSYWTIDGSETSTSEIAGILRGKNKYYG